MLFTVFHFSEVDRPVAGRFYHPSADLLFPLDELAFEIEAAVTVAQDTVTAHFAVLE